MGNPLNGALYGLFLVLLCLAGWFGNWLGFRWILSGKRKRLRAIYLVVLLATIGLVLVQWPAPLRLGSYAAFHRDPAALPYIWQDRTFFASFWAISAYCVVPLAMWFLATRRTAREYP